VRFFDQSLGRFVQADTIVPLASQGVQAWVRYAGLNNNPIKYTDPSGHEVCDEEGHCFNQTNHRKINGQIPLDWWARVFGINFTGEEWSQKNQRAVINSVRTVSARFARAMGNQTTQ
jgi:hypothetical protein